MGDYQDTILIRLTQKQVDLVNNKLKDFAIQNGKVKYSTEIPDCVYVDEGVWKYVEADYTTKEELLFLEKGNQNLTTYPKRHVKYGCEVPKEDNYIYIIKHWAKTGDSRYDDTGLGIITDEQANEILKAIEISSGSYQENDWVYSLTAEDNGRRKEGENNQTLDVHDRRIDDPNTTLEIAGSATIGMSNDPEMRSKFTIMGETEGQDGTVFGRLVDFYGEGGECIDPETGERFKGNIEDWGHLVPNENYPKVYMNRSEDRFNGEDWTDSYSELGAEIGKKVTKKEGQEDIVTGANYGLGLGTIEATKEIVSHTTITADRGIIIEDGVGDPTDKGISKITTVDENGTPTDIQFIADGAPSHPTNQYALQIKHDGAKIQGHTHIFDETNKNIFKKAIVNNETKIYYPKASDKEEDEEYTDKIISGCWFCEATNPHQGQTEDTQYGHWCTNKDGKEIFVIDLWPGFLYHEIDKEIPLIATDPLGDEIYIYTTMDGKEYCLEQDDQERYIKKEIVDESDYNPEYYRRNNEEGDIDNQYFVANLRELNKHFIPGIDANGKNRKGAFKEVNGFVTGYASKIAERVVPQTHRIYQVILGYTQVESQNRTDPICSDIPYPLLPTGTTVAVNDYIYWDGTYFRIVGDDYPEDYNMSAGYGSLTVGTRAEGYKENDTIGQHALEVGTNNEAVGDNSVAQGDSNYASAVDSHAEGLHTKVTGEFSHAEGTGQFRNDIHKDGTLVPCGINGKTTEVKGVASHAEGGAQYIEGAQSHAEGRGHKILGYYTNSAHAEGSENEIQAGAHYSHAEGELNIITNGQYDSHVEGLGNIVDRTYQHLAGVLANTKHQVDTYYSDDTETKAEKSVIYAIGDGASEKRRPDRINTTDKLRAYWKYEDNEWIEYAKLPDSENPILTEKVSALPTTNIDPDTYYYLYEKGNLFAVTEDGDTYVAGHLEVDGTSDLSGRATIGDSSSVDDHSDANPALDVLKHSRFREKVTIERDGQPTADLDMTWPTDDISLAVEGESLFGDTLTIGEGSEAYYKYISNTWTVVQPPQDTSALVITIYGYNNLPTGAEIQNNAFYKVLEGTFWGNLDNNAQYSKFIGLNVHGEIKNERIPEDLYTSMIVQGERKFNEFADKFWTNSSIATNTATYRGCYTKADYDSDPEHPVDPYNSEEMAAWLDENIKPFVAGNILEFNSFEDLPSPINYWKYATIGQTDKWIKINSSDIPSGITPEIVYKLNEVGELNHYYELHATMNAVYYIPNNDPALDRYYQWVWDDDTHTTGDYTEVDATPDNNDYCFVQIEEDSLILPYVLFPDEGGLDNGLNNEPLELTGAENDGKNIITHRYKYVQILDPTTGEVLNQGWRFEYQLNNSGFTQAQWNAINSGVTSTWRASIENDIRNLNTTLTTEIKNRGDADKAIWTALNKEISDRGNADDNIRAALDEEINDRGDADSAIWDALNQEIADRIEADNTIRAALNNYVGLNNDQNISGKKNFTNSAGIGLDSVYLKKNTNSSGTFKLPDRAGYANNKQEVLLSTSDLDNYVTVVSNNIQDISSKKNFTNSDGIGINGNYLKGSGTNSGPFILPSSGAGELALKSDLDNIFEEYLLSGTLRGTYSNTAKEEDIAISGTVIKTKGNFNINGKIYNRKYTFRGSRSRNTISDFIKRTHTVKLTYILVNGNKYDFTSKENTQYIYPVTDQASSMDKGKAITISEDSINVINNNLTYEWSMFSWFAGRELTFYADIIWYANES